MRREVGSHVGREREREIEGGSEAALSTEEGSMWCTNSLFFLYEERTFDEISRNFPDDLRGEKILSLV